MQKLNTWKEMDNIEKYVNMFFNCEFYGSEEPKPLKLSKQN